MPSSPAKLITATVSLLLAYAAAAGPAYPLKALPGKHHVVDQNNAPFFIQGDSPWFLIQALNGADVDYYLSNRWVQGFNSIILGLTLQKQDGAQDHEGDVYGQIPFTNTLAGPFTNLLSWNERYFTNVDAVIRRAGDYGICVFAYPLYDSYNGQSGYVQMAGNPTNSIYLFGQFIGNRYRNFTNLVWIGAGDYNEPNPPNYLWNWVAAGIKSADPNHLFSAQAERPVSAASYYSNFVTLNSTYGSQFPYIESLAAYQRTPIMPSFAREPFYEHRNITGTPYGALDCRRFAWWAVLGGDAGHFFGNEHQWPFATGWQGEMWSTATTSMTNVIRLMNTRPWYDCIPDANHSVVTGGYGTWGSGNYISVMREATGKTVLAYIPGYSMTPTVDMTKISGPSANVWWYDPRTGGATAAGDYNTTGARSFTPPDGNDWVLVLDDASQNYGPPGQGTGNTLRVLSTNPTSGTVGVAYSALLTASGGTEPYSWSVVSNAPPDGLILATDGVLSGTPAASGTNLFTVRVTDASSATADATLMLVINPQPPVVTTSTLTNGTVGVDYSALLTASGGTEPYSWSVVSNAPPAGLTLADDGALSGTPAELGTNLFTVRMTDASSATADATLTLVINPGLLVVTTSTLTNGTVGVDYSALLTASGGSAPYTWSVVSNTPPAGLTLATNGVLSGTPAEPGTNLFTVRVTDAGSQTATADFQMTVTYPLVSLTMPQQTSDEISQAGFRIFLSSNTPGFYLIEWTPDFLLWEPVLTVEYTNGLVEVLDSGASNSAFRFYRAGLSSNDVANPSAAGLGGRRSN